MEKNIDKADHKLKSLMDSLRKDNSKLIKNKTCICCNKEIEKWTDGKKDNPLAQEKSMWKNGAVAKVSCGFGSKFDMDTFFIAVCDDCIEKAYKKKSIERVLDITKKVKGIGLLPEYQRQ